MNFLHIVRTAVHQIQPVPVLMLKPIWFQIRRALYHRHICSRIPQHILKHLLTHAIYLESMGYAGYTAHFEEFGADGRFTQLPLLAASSLMVDGYGYAAEGDATTAMLVAAMMRLCGIANFSEMYMMDLKRDAILLCHAGEGNWATCRPDQKPFLMDRVFNEGGLGNPPTPIFTPAPGPAAVMSLAHVGGERFRLVYAHGEMLDKRDLRKCDMPYMFFHPRSGVRECVKAWLEQGGTHHEAIVYGDQTARIRLWCTMLGIEFVSI